MAWRQYLEILSMTFGILASSVVLYGAFKGIKNGFFHKLHETLHHHHASHVEKNKPS